MCSKHIFQKYYGTCAFGGATNTDFIKQRTPAVYPYETSKRKKAFAVTEAAENPYCRRADEQRTVLFSLRFKLYRLRANQTQTARSRSRLHPQVPSQCSIKQSSADKSLHCFVG